MASLTKLMTAPLVLDAGQLDHNATVPPLRIAGDESQAGLEPGDHVSQDELLHAMLVASAGDAARTLAVDVASDEPRAAGAPSARVRRSGGASARSGVPHVRLWH